MELNNEGFFEKTQKKKIDFFRKDNFYQNSDKKEINANFKFALIVPAFFMFITFIGAILYSNHETEKIAQEKKHLAHQERLAHISSIEQRIIDLENSAIQKSKASHSMDVKDDPNYRKIYEEALKKQQKSISDLHVAKQHFMTTMKEQQTVYNEIIKEIKENNQ